MPTWPGSIDAQLAEPICGCVFVAVTAVWLVWLATSIDEAYALSAL